MNILIIYSSKKGTTQKVAYSLVSKLTKHNVTVKDYQSSNVSDINNADFIIIGTSVYVGKPSKKFQDFCLNNLEYLVNKQTALFMCGLEKEQYEEEFQNAFPKRLINNSQIISIFGGEVILKNLNFLEKIMLKKMKGLDKDLHLLDEKEIENFANAVNAL
ncbi:MAG: flavodoxin domain-containing protein [Candidatus Kapaibacteriota bacterium]